MTFEFHANRATYFEHQYRTCRDSIIPLIGEVRPIDPSVRVLDIGSAEGGVLKAFAARGCHCTGIERNRERLALAQSFLAEELGAGLVELVTSDIYDVLKDGARSAHYDVIVLKDVVEHIHDQRRFVAELRRLLAPGGVVFFGFPPWHMPFGGHQQMCENKLLASLPYVHLLPRAAYERLLHAFGETEKKVNNLLEVKDTGISIERFESIVRAAGYTILRRKLYLVSPIYRHKFGLPPLRQLRPVAALPGLRNLVTTAAYYVVG